MNAIDLRRQHMTVDELLQAAGGDGVRITSKDGDEFIIEPADAFEREVTELGQSSTFMAFLAERSAEPGRTSLAEIELRLPPAGPPEGE